MIRASSFRVAALGDGTADVLFGSKLLEHLTGEEVLATLWEARRELRPAIVQQRFLVATPRG